MNILIIGEHFSNNLGDQIISECFRYVLERKNVCFTLLDLSAEENELVCKDLPNTNSKKIDFIRKIKCQVLKNSFFNIVHQILKSKRQEKYYLKKVDKKYNGAIYIGGSVFMDYFAPKQFFLNKILNKHKIPVFYNACGMGSINSNISKILLKKAISFSNVQYISLRDSVKLFNEIFVQDVIATSDIGLLANKVYGIESNKKNKIGIGCISLSEKFDRDFYTSLYGLIKVLEKNRIEWQLFSNGNKNDSIVMIEFYNELSRRGLNSYGSIKNIPKNTNELATCICQYSRIITCRLHSAIVAYSYQVPAIALNWSDKIKDFYSQIGHEDFVIKPVFDGELIAEKLNAIEYNFADSKRLEELQHSAESNILRILSNI